MELPIRPTEPTFSPCYGPESAFLPFQEGTYQENEEHQACTLATRVEFLYLQYFATSPELIIYITLDV